MVFYNDQSVKFNPRNLNCRINNPQNSLPYCYILLTCLAADPYIPSVGAPSVCGGISVCAEGEL